MYIRMGTRGSALALVQRSEVKALLEKAYSQHSFGICVITVKGDHIQHMALDQMKDKGTLVEKMEQQLLEHTTDLVVHNMRDTPSALDERLCSTETLLREDARDILVLRNVAFLESLSLHVRIATGGKQRRFQLLRQREDLEVVDIHRNIKTRLKKLEDQQLDGIILAAAGLKWLQLAQYITQTLSEHVIVPAVAQGTIAIEAHKKRNDLVKLVNALCIKRVDEEICTEWVFLQELNGGCHTPLGARRILREADAELLAIYGNEDETRLFNLCVSGPRAQTQATAMEAAQRLQKKVGKDL